MLAIMDALYDWRQYLIGTAEPFEIWTDHQNLLYFKQPQKLNRRQAQWVLQLADYNFKLIHKSATQMKKADLLSRQADLDVASDNKDVILLDASLFRQVTIEGLDQQFLKRINKGMHQMDSIVRQHIINKDDNWEESDGLYLWQGRIYVPRDNKLRVDIIHAHHDG